MKISRQTLEHRGQNAGFAPVLKAPMHGRSWTVAAGQILPRRTGAQDPQNPIDRRALLAPRSPAAILSDGIIGNELLDGLPLGIG
jgi:hypothetical protein